MLDGLDLVHMNGRVYDPRIARFVSANPIVQSPDNGQSWNRYSYVWNNPTNATDPTGYQAKNENDKKRTDPPPENEPKCKGQECIDQRNPYYHVSYPNGPSNGAGKGKADAPGATEGKETSTSAPNPRRQISAEEYAVADRAMAQYMQCESIECIRAAQSNMLSIRNSLVAAHVSTYDLSRIGPGSRKIVTARRRPQPPCHHHWVKWSQARAKSWQPRAGAYRRPTAAGF